MSRLRMGRLRRRYGRSFTPTSTSGAPIAVNGKAAVTKEPDGLYYTWRSGNWYLAFKSKHKAMAHMRVMAKAG